MFTAFVVACMINGECVRFNDARGPYATLAECEARIHEMKEDIIETPLLMLPFRFTDEGCGGGEET